MPIPAAFNRMTRTVRNSAARMTRTQKLSAAGVAVVGASVLAVSVVPGSVQAAANPSNPVMGAAQAAGTPHTTAPAAPSAPAAKHEAKAHTTDLAKRLLDADKKAKVHAGHAPAVKKAVDRAVKQAAPAHKAPAHHHAAKAHHAPAAKKLRAADVAASSPAYPDNLDGWIHHALSIMHKHHIPGSYEGIHRNVMRESSGNPKAINLWDINAQKGIPSKGLLQVIPPTFSHYHVVGTSKNIYDPVANIVAACNYAADRYGSMDNVDSAY